MKSEQLKFAAKIALIGVVISIALSLFPISMVLPYGIRKLLYIIPKLCYGYFFWTFYKSL